MYLRRIFRVTWRTGSGAVASGGAVRRVRPRTYLAGTTALLALLVLIAGGTALGSSVSSASFNSGGVVIGGTRYAKQGQTVTLTVATSSDTKCVEITGAHTARQTNTTAQSSWTFSFTAGSGNGLQTVTAAASPNFNANNCTGQSQAPQNASYVLDNTGPAVTGLLSPAANGAGWNNSNVGITWSATDSGSGVASGPTPATDSQTSNTAGVTKTATATDRLGNSGNGSVTVKLDKMNPTVTITKNPAANGSGWNNTNVTVGITCSDALSGISSCTGGGTFNLTSETAGQTLNATAVDAADNNASASTTVKIDKTAPSLSGAPTTSSNAAGWYNGNVAIHWTCADALSGIAGSCPANSTISSEGTGLTASASVSDNAGNATNATSSPAVKIDKTAPLTTASAVSFWNNVDVSVDLNASDGLSGVDATYFSVDSGATQGYLPLISQPSFSSEGIHSLEYWSVDAAGNEETHHTINVRIDKTPPTIHHTLSPAANGNGWNNADAIVHFICGDALSGVAACTSDQAVTTEGSNQTVTGTALDNAGNSATDPASVSLDKTPPTIHAAASPAANANGWNDSDVTVSFSCSDVLSGIASCPLSQALGEGANQSASGTAFDNADNSASAGVTGINVDKTDPSLSGAATTSPNGNGWYNGDVGVNWTCSDALSGIDGSCPADDILIGEGSNLSASASVSDKAGNSKNATVSGIQIDRTTPVTLIGLPAPAVDDWYAGPALVTLDASDNLSGVGSTFYKVDDGAAQLYSAPFSFNQNGIHTITFWSTDLADNVEDAGAPGHVATVKIDTVDPTISGERSPAANTFGWNNAPVTVTFDCSDADSGIRVSPPGCPDPTLLTGEGAGQSVTGTAHDRVGNHASATVSDINIDLTAPGLSGAPTSAPNADGWYRDDVTIDWTASDALSGVDPSTVPADSIIIGEGADLGAGPVSVSDKAGNGSSASVTAIKIDRTAPTIEAHRSPAANANGWNKGDVTVSFVCDDVLSGVKTCPPDVVRGEGANQSATGTAYDKADNSASATVNDINVDKTYPTITATATNADTSPYTAGTWTNQPVTVHFDCADSLSGLDGACPDDVTVSSSTPAAGQMVSASVSDKAGNTTGANLLVEVDLSAPSITASPDRAANANGWYKADVTVSFSCSDTPSGIASCPPSQTLGEGQNQSAGGTAFDIAGNSASTAVNGISIDKTAPTITATAKKADNSAYTPGSWTNQAVTVHFTCADGLSGIDGSCPADVMVSNSTGAAGQTVSGAVSDMAGNGASANLLVRVDKDSPALAITAPGNNTTVSTSAVQVTGTASDSPSGLQGVTVNGTPTSVVGGSFTTSFSLACGSNSITGVATDNAGNQTTVSVSVTRSCLWVSPALQPVASSNGSQGIPTATNLSVFKIKSTIPVKFQVYLDQAMTQLMTTPPTGSSARLSFEKYDATTDSSDAVDILPSGNANTDNLFRWTGSPDYQYIYNLATAGKTAGTYRVRLTLFAADGTTVLGQSAWQYFVLRS